MLFGISRVYFYFCSTVANSKHFSLPQKGLEWNSESFLFRGTAANPSEQTIHFVYSVFRGIFFAENSQPYKSDKLGFQDIFYYFCLKALEA